VDIAGSVLLDVASKQGILDQLAVRSVHVSTRVPYCGPLSRSSRRTFRMTYTAQRAARCTSAGACTASHGRVVAPKCVWHGCGCASVCLSACSTSGTSLSSKVPRASCATSRFCSTRTS
jgi:hypothetical protein